MNEPAVVISGASTGIGRACALKLDGSVELRPWRIRDALLARAFGMPTNPARTAEQAGEWRNPISVGA